MKKAFFALRRALFVQPIGLTTDIVKNRVKRAFRRSTPVQMVDHDSRHPIDLQYDIDTSGIIKPGALRAGSKSDIFSVGYGGSQPSLIRHAIAMLADIDRATFIDFGCGKGRPLIVASEYPFERIIGVELAASLCATATKNATHIAKLYPARTAIEIVEADALKFTLPAGYVVVFIFHPFFDALFKPLAQKFAEHGARPGNKTIIIYINPACASAFDALPGFSRVFAANLRYHTSEMGAQTGAPKSDSIAIWQSKTANMIAPRPDANAPIGTTNGFVAVVGDGHVMTLPEG